MKQRNTYLMESSYILMTYQYLLSDTNFETLNSEVNLKVKILLYMYIHIVTFLVECKFILRYGRKNYRKNCGYLYEAQCI